MKVDLELCIVCGQPSEVVCHGVREDEVYDEPYCSDHYNKSKRGQEK